MGFEYWIMEHFALVVGSSLILLLIAHFAVAWLMNQGKPSKTDPKLQDDAEPSQAQSTQKQTQ